MTEQAEKYIFVKNSYTNVLSNSEYNPKKEKISSQQQLFGGEKTF